MHDSNLWRMRWFFAIFYSVLVAIVIIVPMSISIVILIRTGNYVPLAISSLSLLLTLTIRPMIQFLFPHQKQ